MIALLSLLALTSTGSANPGLGAAPSTVDRRTPLSTVDGFLGHSHRRQYEAAAHYLHLQPLAQGRQAAEGKRLARRLTFVLDRTLWFDYGKLSADPLGHPEDGAEVEHLGEVPLGAGRHPVRLERIRVGDEHLWVFSADTVRVIDRLYEQHGAPLGERLPDFMFLRFWILELWQWAGLAVLLALGLLLSWLLQGAALIAASKVAKLTAFAWDDVLVEAARRPLKYLFFPALVAAGSRFLLLPPPVQASLDLGCRTLAIAAVAWFSLRLLRGGADLLQASIVEKSDADPGRVRGLHTQITVLRRVLEVSAVVVGLAMILMQFELVRSVGVSLLASAGLAGLVIGLAAQRSISTLLAGIQLSITQPIRIGDTVIVENEWGWIEEVTLTYVVVKVWDLRRLVIPMTYFLERPFQNWSKVSPEILGTIEVRADFTAEVGAFREELDRILESEEGRQLWDGKVKGIQVTDCTDRVMTLRALISAGDSGKQWNLRCLVRERLLAFLAAHPGWIPVTRYEQPQAGAEAQPPLRNRLRDSSRTGSG